MDLPAFLLAPLVREPGRLVVTDQHLYFQPLNDIVGNAPVRIHPLAGVAAVSRRRSSLQHNGRCVCVCVCAGRGGGEGGSVYGMFGV